MAVTISSSSIQSIDALYPVAGVDNDSQGFRDNFNVIKAMAVNNIFYFFTDWNKFKLKQHKNKHFQPHCVSFKGF